MVCNIMCKLLLCSVRLLLLHYVLKPLQLLLLLLTLATLLNPFTAQPYFPEQTCSSAKCETGVAASVQTCRIAALTKFYCYS
jgi:hypothetical protein